MIAQAILRLRIGDDIKLIRLDASLHIFSQLNGLHAVNMDAVQRSNSVFILNIAALPEGRGAQFAGLCDV
jgi:hypothetical protein